MDAEDHLDGAARHKTQQEEGDDRDPDDNDERLRGA
jgi:hypothetical protein